MILVCVKTLLTFAPLSQRPSRSVFRYSSNFPLAGGSVPEVPRAASDGEPLNEKLPGG